MTLPKIIERALLLMGLAAILAVLVFKFVVPPIKLFEMLRGAPLDPAATNLSYELIHLLPPTLFFGFITLTLWWLLRKYPALFRPSDGGSTPPVAAWRLFLVSALALYFELLVIRWLPSEIRVMNYFKNLSLMCAFLGLGGGMLLKDKRYDLIPFLPLFVGLLAFLAYSPLGKLMGYARVPSADTLVIWFQLEYQVASGVRLVAFYAILLFLIVGHVLCFLPLGQSIARQMRGYSPLRAYSINIVGSLTGVWLFSLLSFLELSSTVWFALGFALWLILIVFSGYLKHALVALVICGATLVGVAISDSGSIWSPYYKIEVVTRYLDTGCLAHHYKTASGKVPWGFTLVYNGLAFVSAVDGSPEFAARYPQYSECWHTGYAFHETPFKIVSPRDKDVLILAAGSGDDAASALRFGARHVDAVDIDPAPLRIGQRYHPEKVYSDPRVSIFVDDARAYLQKARKNRKKYDYILFARLDSQTLFSGMSSIRLDNFVYTRESIKTVRQLLRQDGILAIEHGWPNTASWRLARVIQEHFPQDYAVTSYNRKFYMTGPGMRNVVSTLGTIMYGREPLRILLPGQEGAVDERLSPPGNVGDRSTLAGQQGAVDERLIPTDDWPFLFLLRRHIPGVFFVMGLMLLTLSILVAWHAHGSVRRVRYDLLFLGAGFLLLETKGVVQMALLYGTTWFVNTVVFTVVLVVILLANWVVGRWPRLQLTWLYLGLGASLVVSFFVELGWLFEFSPLMRGVISGVLLGAPFFFASCTFARVFNELGSDEVGLGLGSNLIGSTVGGLAEYTTLLFGIKFLNIIALAFYALSWLVVSARRQ